MAVISKVLLCDLCVSAVKLMCGVNGYVAEKKIFSVSDLRYQP